MEKTSRFSTLLSLALLADLTGCGQSDRPPALAQQAPAGMTVNVTLREWAVMADKTTVASGPVVFRVTNTGTLPHELVILKLHPGMTPDTMPVKDGGVDESASGTVIDEIEETDLPPTVTQSKTVTLTPGEYALFCAVVENNDVAPGTATNQTKMSHYQLGMFAKLTVS
ncbi:MAG: cupredoxin domain-containing protein [Nitrospira sp.]|nr:cupredoxin domain-containing protein [Nitrospira sp.]